MNKRLSTPIFTLINVLFVMALTFLYVYISKATKLSIWAIYPSSMIIVIIYRNVMSPLGPEDKQTKMSFAQLKTMLVQERIIFWSSILAFTFIPLIEGWLLLANGKADMDWIFLITYLLILGLISFSTHTRNELKRFLYGEVPQDANNIR